MDEHELLHTTSVVMMQMRTWKGSKFNWHRLLAQLLITSMISIF